MSTYPVLTVALAIALSTACRSNPAVQVSTNDQSLNTRWHASLASPANLAGAVQMNGSASMAPSADGSGTAITIDLANASPGGRHPWSVHQGQCQPGADYGVFGSNDAYEELEVSSSGAASGTASVRMMTPPSGNYFVVVRASSANWGTVVACGNLAAPTR